jgi:phosphoribosylamine--glycine ligase
MRVLVVGSGGREHALAWACARHESHPEIICAPGNGGTAQLGTNVALSVTDAPAVARLAREKEVDLIVVGPDAALAAGVSDTCREAGLTVFGPSAAAAKIEWSKTHAKQVMDQAGVPTARWRSGTRESRSDLFDFVLELDGHCVVKADGLAAGKGVAVCDTREDAFAALAACLNERRFGDAGSVVVGPTLAGWGRTPPPRTGAPRSERWPRRSSSPPWPHSQRRGPPSSAASTWG